MKSRKYYREIKKTEKLPQGDQKEIDKNKYGQTSSVYTVKETTFEKRFKRTNNNIEDSANTSKKNITSNLKQGTNSGFISQNKIPVSNQEGITEKKVITSRFRRNYLEKKNQNKRYTEKELQQIIKIQNWWRRMLAILNGYKIRDTLREQNKNYVIKSQKIYTEKYISNQNSEQPSVINSFKNSYPYINNLNKMTSSRSYTNINNVTSNMNRNLNPNIGLHQSSSQNYIQTFDKRIITQTSPRIVQSESTSPSVKSKYIIETKKVEIFRKPKNFISTKYVNESNYNMTKSMSHYDIKHIMSNIWNDEVYCSTVESLCCLGDDVKNNISQNTLIFEELEEEIRKLKSLLMQKDEEISNLMGNLRETRNQLNVNIRKNLLIKEGYKQKNLDQDAHELQIITKKIDWNDLNIPSPVSEIFIESFENKMPQKMQYIEGMQIMGKKTEEYQESNQESISDPEAVLEIQEMNALSIISNKIKYKNICQHLQSLMILAQKKEEQSEEYSINMKEKEEKHYGIETIPIEKEPLIFQKIEQINITSIKPKPRKPRNQIQELDGLEIINYKRPKIELKRKVKPKFIPQNVDEISIKSLLKIVEKKKEPIILIQELDGIEIIKSPKEPHIPQCVDEMEIPREYDMLLVKPTWNSLQVQGSGLNLLAIPRDLGLENQEIDEFAILGMEKPDLFIETLENVAYEKPKVQQKIQVLIPLPENNIEKSGSFKINGIKKETEVKVVEKIVVKNAEKKIIPNIISKIDRFKINGIKKETEVKVVEKIIEKRVEKKIVPNEIINLEKFAIEGKEKKEIRKIINLKGLFIKGKEKKVVINKITSPSKFQLRAIKRRQIVEKQQVVEKQEVIEEKEPYENIEENVVEISILRKQKKIEPNEIIIIDSIHIDGIEQIKEEKEEEEYVPIKRKGFVEKIKKNIITKDKKEVRKIKLFVQKRENFFIPQAYSLKQEFGKVETKTIIVHEFNNINIGDKISVSLYGKPKKGKKMDTIENFEEEEEIKKEEPMKIIIEKKIPNDWNKKIRPSTSSLIIYGKQIKPQQSYVKIIKKKEETQHIEPKIVQRPELEIILGDEIKLEQLELPQLEMISGDEIVLSQLEQPKLQIVQKEVIETPIQQKQIIKKEVTETVEKVVRNWKDELKMIKSTKLNIAGQKRIEKVVKQEKIIEKIIEKEKEEYDIENYAFNLISDKKKIILDIENFGFDLEGNKGMILKEGPAQTIKITKEKITKKITKEQVLIPSYILQLSLMGQPKKEEKIQEVKKIEEIKKSVIKPKMILKSVKENQLFIQGIEIKYHKTQFQQIQKYQVSKNGTIKTISWNDLNSLTKESNFNFLHERVEPAKQIETKEVVKTVEKIVEVGKIIDWNKDNQIENNSNINIIRKRVEKEKGKVQIIEIEKKMDWNKDNKLKNIGSINLLGKELEKPKEITKTVEKIIEVGKVIDWNKVNKMKIIGLIVSMI